MAGGAGNSDRSAPRTGNTILYFTLREGDDSSIAVPPIVSHNTSMEIKDKEQLKYKQLLDLDWAIRKSELQAQKKYDEYHQAYGKHDKKDLLTELAYEELKGLREARKTLHKAVRILKANDLYTNGV